MRTTLVLIGDELLNGSVSDTAASWIGEKLLTHGFALSHVQVVGDDLAAISDAINVATARGDAVVLTGGLGPTSDDLTRQALARTLRVPLLRDRELLDLIAKRYAALGRTMPKNAEAMAELPEGSTPLLNQEGSAPGIKAVIDGVLIFALPGVPREMREMFSHEVLPVLLRQFQPEQLTTLVLRIAIEGESAVAAKLHQWEQSLSTSVSVAYLAELGNVLVKVTGTHESEVRSQAESAAELIGDSIYAIQNQNEPPRQLQAEVLRLLRDRDESIATAESLTGGGVGKALTDVPGSSENYLGGFITYSPALKIELLNVPAELIFRVGTVDPQIALAMAHGARLATGADWAVATTGVAGPTPSEGQDPGTVYIAMVGSEQGFERVIRLDIRHLSRALVRRATVIHTLELVRRTLSGLGNAIGVTEVTQLVHETQSKS